MPETQRRPTRRAQTLRNNATDAERMLWVHLSRRQLGGFKFSRQIPVGPYICDFLCRERGLVVELDGGQHAAQFEQDARRTHFLEDQGFSVVRFWNHDVLENMDGVLLRILDHLQKRPPRFQTSLLPLAGGEKARSVDGVDAIDVQAHPQPPPASGRGLS